MTVRERERGEVYGAAPTMGTTGRDPRSRRFQHAGYRSSLGGSKAGIDMPTSVAHMSKREGTYVIQFRSLCLYRLKKKDTSGLSTAQFP